MLVRLTGWTEDFIFLLSLTLHFRTLSLISQTAICFSWWRKSGMLLILQYWENPLHIFQKGNLNNLLTVRWRWPHLEGILLILTHICLGGKQQWYYMQQSVMCWIKLSNLLILKKNMSSLGKCLVKSLHSDFPNPKTWKINVKPVPPSTHQPRITA